MNNYKSKLKEDLFGFRTYLTEIARIADITADDYCRRILAICGKEGLTPNTLSEEIERVYYLYTEGEKKEEGAKSHNANRSALKQYLNFVTTQPQGKKVSHEVKTNHNGRYIFRALRGEYRGIWVVYLIDLSTNKAIDSRAVGPEGGKDKLFQAMWEMSFPLLKDDAFSILANVGLKLEMQKDDTKALTSFC